MCRTKGGRPMDSGVDEGMCMQLAHEVRGEVPPKTASVEHNDSSTNKRQHSSEEFVSYWQRKKKARSSPDLRELGSHEASSAVLGPFSQDVRSPQVAHTQAGPAPHVRALRFPEKMHAILSTHELGDVVAWLPTGQKWRISKPREFEIKVLPKYFDHSKFSSFIREAYCWGFKRVTQGLERNSFYHELFLRGQVQLSRTMEVCGTSLSNERNYDSVNRRETRTGFNQTSSAAPTHATTGQFAHGTVARSVSYTALSRHDQSDEMCTED